ncbi:helix-turn-helix domain-containing protein [Caldicellulosiruptoraceae bacterium PP1]
MEKEVLNLEEAAQFLGISTKTFSQILKDEDIPARKIGREWRFSKNALLDWLSKGSSKDYFTNKTLVSRYEYINAGRTSDIIEHSKELLNKIQTEKYIEIEGKYFEFPDNVVMEAKIKKRADTTKFELEFEWENTGKEGNEDGE